MKQTDLPIKINIPWASGESASYVQEVPDASQQQVTAGAASWTDGFPPLCFTSKASGGVPPAGKDMNGALKRVSAWTRYLMAAGVVPYDATWQAANGGYPLNAVVATSYTGASGTSGTLGRMWVSLVDGNTTNPDTGGTGWTYLALISDVLLLINQQVPVIARPKLTANLALYVAANGSDTNNGTSAATPFATRQKAWNTLMGYDLNGYSVTVNVADGTYTDGVLCLGQPVGFYGASQILFRGNTGTPGNCAINVTNGCPFITSAGTNINVQGFALNSTNSNTGAIAGYGLYAYSGGIINFGYITFGGCAVAHIGGNAGQISSNGLPYNISGSAQAHIQAQSGAGNVTISGSAVNFLAAPTFSSATVVAFTGGQITAAGTTFAGSYAGTIGPRYNASNYGLIQTNGGGANFFPGNAAGTTSNGLYT